MKKNGKCRFIEFEFYENLAIIIAMYERVRLTLINLLRLVTPDGGCLANG